MVLRDSRGRFGPPAQNKKRHLSAPPGRSDLWRGPLFQAELLETLVESGELTAGVEQAMVAARPGRMRRRIDIQTQGIALFPVGRAGLVLGSLTQ